MYTNNVNNSLLRTNPEWMVDERSDRRAAASPVACTATHHGWHRPRRRRASTIVSFRLLALCNCCKDTNKHSICYIYMLNDTKSAETTSVIAYLLHSCAVTEYMIAISIFVHREKKTLMNKMQSNDPTIVWTEANMCSFHMRSGGARDPQMRNKQTHMRKVTNKTR